MNFKRSLGEEILMDFSLSKEMGPRWLIYLSVLGLPIFFALGLNNSTLFYETLPHDVNGDVVVFYQPSCPHCIAEVPTIKKLVSLGYRVSAVNVFQHPDLARAYGVESTPTIVVFPYGIKLVGEQDLNTILKALKGIHGEGSGESCSVGGSTCSPT